jgi:hypothetical protein
MLKRKIQTLIQSDRIKVGDVVGVVPVMTDIFAPPTKAVRNNDLQMLAQVERWMATIREIDREKRAEIGSASARLEHLLAPAAE